MVRKFFTLCFVFLGILCGCAEREVVAPRPKAPDYAQAEAWAFLPSGLTNKPVDVFYVYPTIFGGNGPEEMDISQTDLRAKADVQIRINAGVFTETANLFAPYYRQASIEVVWMNEREGATLLKDGYQDVIRAFDYYMDHLNQGRPFILAGFSQGSMALLNLMEKKFDNPKWRRQLVAAYLIGYSVTEDDLEHFPWLKMAQGERDTGVIISYNTQLPGYGYSYVHKKGGIAINPVNWRTDSTVAPASLHKGAVLFDIVTGEKLEEIPHFSDTWLEADTGALAVYADAQKYNASQTVFAPGIMHMYDYMFFYNNLKDNVHKRTQVFLQEKGIADPR